MKLHYGIKAVNLLGQFNGHSRDDSDSTQVGGIFKDDEFFITFRGKRNECFSEETKELSKAVLYLVTDYSFEDISNAEINYTYKDSLGMCFFTIIDGDAIQMVISIKPDQLDVFYYENQCRRKEIIIK